MSTQNSFRQIIIIKNFIKFTNTEKTVEFAHTHLNKYKYDAWNVFSFDPELEQFLKDNDIDYTVTERKPFE